MEKLKITKGTAYLSDICEFGLMVSVDERSAVAKFYANSIITNKESNDNALLFIDAVDAYADSETLPSELLRQNREMKEALEKIKESIAPGKIWMIIDDCLTSCNKGKE